MASFELYSKRGSAFLRLATGLLLLIVFPLLARAQQPPQGFAVERFYPSAPGGGWFVMDDLNISGGLGWALSLTGGYARNPQEVTGVGGQQFALVSDEAFVNLGLAVTYDRYRFYLDLPVPLVVDGVSGIAGSYQLSAPAVNVATNPDSVSDPRVGFDARLFGKPGDLLRLGAGAQLWFPSGPRADYTTDGTYREMFRLLAAGDAGKFSYAGQLGVQLRRVNYSVVPGFPDGNELLFGASAGRKFAARKNWALIVGPEFFGGTATRSFSSQETDFEGLLTGRLERTGGGRHVRIKMGIGHALVQHFGAPEWRALLGVELFGNRP
jgi:hypothetical protein